METQPYRVKFRDCSTPTNIKRLNIYTACESENENESETEELAVLQQMRNQILKGHKCRITRSQWTLYCGAFSHEKFIKAPEIEIVQPLSASACENLINTNTFTSHYGTTHGVALGEETVFSVNELGVTHTESSGKVWCKGQTMKLGDTVIDEVLVMSQYRIALEKEEFLTNPSPSQTVHQVEALFDHVKLPRSCTPAAGGCVANDWTYIWNPEPIKCKLMKVQQGVFTKENGFLVDHKLKLLFKITGENAGLPGCPPGKLMYTEQRGIVLSQNRDYKWIDRQIDLTLFTDQKDDYIVYKLEQAAGKLKNNMNKKLCNNRYSTFTNGIVPMNEDRFAKRIGDILYTFTCPEKMGKIKPMHDTCVSKIPLESGLYMDPTSRIASKHASKIECSNHFPLTILSEDGWVTVSDTIKPAIAPTDMKLLKEKTGHENMKTGGIYRHEALTQFEDILEYGSFHEAIIETLGYGICRKDGPCNAQNTPGSIGISSAPVYDLQRLAEGIEEEMNFFKELDKWITRNGGYLALIVILGWSVQILISGGMVLMTLMKDGVAAALAAVYAVFCFLPNQVSKVSRAAQRRAAMAAAPPEEVPMFMKPV